MKTAFAIAASLCALLFAAAHADINVGVTVSATGPAATLGIPEKNTVALLPTTIAGEKVNYIVFDDATDPTNAVKNINKLLTENKVDVLIGSSTVPTSLAALGAAAENKTPIIVMGPVEPTGEKHAWTFRTVPTNVFMAAPIVDHMVHHGVKTVAYIGFADSFGDSVARATSEVGEAKGLKIVASERYARADTSVIGQVLKILSAKPDAVMIGASGVPGALPQITLRERGYQGAIYQTQGIVNRDFLRIGGKSVEGTLVPVGPIVVAEQLPDSHPSKKPALEYKHKYDAAYGANSANTFGALAWDAGLMIQAAVPVALKKAKPGTPQFRQALRDALEGVRELPASQGVYNLSAKDHQGFDERARFLVRSENGQWKLVK